MRALPRVRGAPAAASACAALRRAAPSAAPRRRAAQPRRAAAASTPQHVGAATLAPSEAERAAEAALSVAGDDIAGIPRAEWLRLQAPARYLGNEWGAVHKPWDDATIRFALAYPEARARRRAAAATRASSPRDLAPRGGSRPWR
jgi:hypothetical protein